MPSHPANTLKGGFHVRSELRLGLPALMLAGLAVACTTPAAPTPSPTATPTSGVTPTPGATPTPAVSPGPTGSPSGVIVTIRVSGEEYRVLVTDAQQIAYAEALLEGEEAHGIPNGRVIVGDDGGVNTGWSWHIDPNDFEFVDMTIELCDGRPSFVERGEVDGGRFCPWSAEVVDVEPAG